jgi:hypothetical protein
MISSVAAAKLPAFALPADIAWCAQQFEHDLFRHGGAGPAITLWHPEIASKALQVVAPNAVAELNSSFNSGLKCTRDAYTVLHDECKRKENLGS